MFTRSLLLRLKSTKFKRIKSKSEFGESNIEFAKPQICKPWLNMTISAWRAFNELTFHSGFYATKRTQTPTWLSSLKHNIHNWCSVSSDDDVDCHMLFDGMHSICRIKMNGFASEIATSQFTAKTTKKKVSVLPSCRSYYKAQIVTFRRLQWNLYSVYRRYLMFSINTLEYLCFISFLFFLSAKKWVP